MICIYMIHTMHMYLYQIYYIVKHNQTIYVCLLNLDQYPKLY